MWNTKDSGRRREQHQTGLPASVHAAVAALFAIVGFAAVYVTLGVADNPRGGQPVVAGPPVLPAAPPPASTPTPAKLPSGPGANPLSVGEMATFVFKREPEPLPAVAFVDAAGKERSLADWKGKVVLLNLWATWCAPCRKEMPGIDRLKAELGSPDFDVIAVSVDRTGIPGAKRFLEQIKVQNLEVLADPTARMGATLRAVGMPVTLLIDRQGREIGRLTGPAEWDSEDAKRLIRAAVAANPR